MPRELRGIQGTPDKNGIIWQRGRISGGRRVWAVKDTTTGVATQGNTKAEARRNLREAVTLYNEVSGKTSSN